MEETGSLNQDTATPYHPATAARLTREVQAAHPEWLVYAMQCDSVSADRHFVAVFTAERVFSGYWHQEVSTKEMLRDIRRSLERQRQQDREW